MRNQYSVFIKSKFLNDLTVDPITIKTELENQTVAFNCILKYKELETTFSFDVHVSSVYPAALADSPVSVFHSIFSLLSEEEKVEFKLLRDCYDSADDMIILITDMVLKEYGNTKEYKIKNVFGTYKSDFVGQLTSHFSGLNLLNNSLSFDDILPF